MTKIEALVRNALLARPRHGVLVERGLHLAEEVLVDLVEVRLRAEMLADVDRQEGAYLEGVYPAPHVTAISSDPQPTYGPARDAGAGA